MSAWPEEQTLEEFIKNESGKKILGMVDRNMKHSIFKVAAPVWTFGQSAIGGAVDEVEVYARENFHGFLAGASIYKGPLKTPNVGDEHAVETAGLSIVIDGGKYVVDLVDMGYRPANSGAYTVALTVDPGALLISGVKDDSYSSIDRRDIVLNAPIEITNSISVLVRRRIINIKGIYVGGNTYEFSDCTASLILI